ncbi:hypothetical protein [Streptomyces sp. CB02488]|uniref:hypothetical protein n=1 Tax=Streptomyces sp. CB02488 TaxID=1703920 RepID=UPI000A79A82E|nr:hypothetical protein [Streptomyces sp. CB02488]
MSFDEGFVSDMAQTDAPSGVIVNALRWEILNDWTQYQHDDMFEDKTAEMSYWWGFVKRDTGFESLKCLWAKHESNYPMFAEAIWLLHREFSEGAGADHHPLFANVPPIPAEVLFQKIASCSAPVHRSLTQEQMVAILRKAPQDYSRMS